VLYDGAGLDGGLQGGGASRSSRNNFFRNDRRAIQLRNIFKEIGVTEEMSGNDMLSLVLNNQEELPQVFKSKVGKVVFDSKESWDRRGAIVRRKYLAANNRSKRGEAK
jgi:hypothetical protein